MHGDDDHASSAEHRAAELRAMGINHERLVDDAELEATVELLRSLGVTIDEMIGADLLFIAGPKALRPDATILPSDVLDFEVDFEFARQMTLALGFNFDEDDLLLTPAEADAIRFFMMQREVFGDDETLAIIRVIGSAMARVARSIVSALRMQVELPIFEATGSIIEVTHAYQDAVRDQLPPFLATMNAVLRRHLALMSGPSPLWNIETSEAATMEVIGVGFIDLVGFTAFVEQAAQSELVEALRSFERQVNAMVVANGGVLVKLIGDEAMFVAPTVDASLRIASEARSLALDRARPTSVRVGLAWGEVAAIDGDYFGTVVNLAARAVDQAEPDTILVTDEIVASASSTWSFSTTGAHVLRGITEAKTLWRLDRE